jgi:hypothetical protein
MKFHNQLPRDLGLWHSADVVGDITTYGQVIEKPFSDAAPAEGTRKACEQPRSFTTVPPTNRAVHRYLLGRIPRSSLASGCPLCSPPSTSTSCTASDRSVVVWLCRIRSALHGQSDSPKSYETSRSFPILEIAINYWDRNILNANRLRQ